MFEELNKRLYSLINWINYNSTQKNIINNEDFFVYNILIFLISYILIFFFKKKRNQLKRKNKKNKNNSEKIKVIIDGKEEENINKDINQNSNSENKKSKNNKRRKKNKKNKREKNNYQENNNEINNNNINTNNILNDSNTNLNDITKDKEDIFSMIKEEPKIGLNNIGATCYMNATLQCLSHTIKLTKYFLSSKGQNLINSAENQLSKSYLEVIKRLWIKKYNKNSNNYSPKEFKDTISEMDPLFQGIAANDSKDLINFIIQQLHIELNKIKNNFIGNKNISQYNEEDMLNNFIEDFKNNNCSIISDIFYGIIETITECQQCKYRNILNGIYTPLQSYNFQIINFIIFPLEEIRNWKSNIQNFYYNEVNLKDCFDYYEKDERMDGENQMWCNICKQNTTSIYKTIIYSSPQYFIFILNRGKGNIYNVKLNFEEFINITNYVKLKDGNLIYKLYAIVTHIGPSSMSGHFIAFCRSSIDNYWYKYNDSIVDLIGNFYKDVHEFGTPYILFYERQ